VITARLLHCELCLWSGETADCWESGQTDCSWNNNKCAFGSYTDHVSGLFSSCSSLLYMLRICMRSYGISDTSLQDVFRATVVDKLTYCSPAWSGYCTAADLGRLDGFLRRCRLLGYCEQREQVLLNCSMTLMIHFSRIISNSKHILQQFLHDRTTTYSFRSRNHSKVLVNKTSHLNNSDFLIRLLYKYSY